jgi:hypothetical protein
MIMGLIPGTALAMVARDCLFCNDAADPMERVNPSEMRELVFILRNV